MSTTSETTFTLSTRRRRIAAFIIDHFVMTFAMVSIIFLVLGPTFVDDNSMGNMTKSMLVVMLPGLFLYLAKDTVKGVSLGKWIMGIMVRDTNHPNNFPSFVKLFTRNLLLIIWPVEFIVLAADREKRRLGDRAAGTMVVNNPNKSNKGPRILTLVGVCTAFFAFSFLFAGSAIKSSDAYKVAVREIEVNEEILNATGGIKGYGMMPAGNINISNGIGEARLQIKVLGIEKDLNVNVYLTKESNGQWRIVELR
jgi:uncharacterized RDD family membrane protein YckC